MTRGSARQPPIRQDQTQRSKAPAEPKLTPALDTAQMRPCLKPRRQADRDLRQKYSRSEVGFHLALRLDQAICRRRSRFRPPSRTVLYRCADLKLQPLFAI
jgi:hypothetical protein